MSEKCISRLHDAAMFETLLGEAPIGMAYLDRDLRYLWVNDTLAALNGVPSAEHIGKRVHDIVPKLASTAEDVVQRILMTGQPVRNQEFPCETVEQPHVRRYWKESWYPVRNDGEICGFGAIVEEVTDIKRADEARNDSERRLQRAVELVGVSPYSWDPLTGELYWDRHLKAMWGLPPDAVVNYDVFVAGLHPDDRQRVEAACARAADPTGDGLYAEEFRVIGLEDGIERWVYANGQTVFENGRPVTYTGAAIETTERKREAQVLRETKIRLEALADQLEQKVAERTKELLESQERLRALATELNLAEQRERKRIATELHDHLAQMLVLVRLKLGQGKQGPLLRTQTMIEQGEKLLDDALTYMRGLVAELSPPILHEFGLPAALRWLGEHMKQFDIHVTVGIDTSESMALPEDQAVLLFQSTRELLINAVKHAVAKHVTVLVAVQDDQLRVTVRDEGVGFDTSATSPSKFGLFSIRERMHALGGGFEIQSVRGEGTTATLVLPFQAPPCPAEAPVSTVAVTQSSPPAISTGAQTRVLVVDDHALMRQGLRSVLESYRDLEVAGEAAMEPRRCN